MIVLDAKKTEHLRELICMWYGLENEADRADLASTIVGILDYIIHTESIPEEDIDEEVFD